MSEHSVEVCITTFIFVDSGNETAAAVLCELFDKRFSVINEEVERVFDISDRNCFAVEILKRSVDIELAFTGKQRIIRVLFVLIGKRHEYVILFIIRSHSVCSEVRCRIGTVIRNQEHERVVSVEVLRVVGLGNCNYSCSRIIYTIVYIGAIGSFIRNGNNRITSFSKFDFNSSATETVIRRKVSFSEEIDSESVRLIVVSYVHRTRNVNNKIRTVERRRIDPLSIVGGITLENSIGRSLCAISSVAILDEPTGEYLIAELNVCRVRNSAYLVAYVFIVNFDRSRTLTVIIEFKAYLCIPLSVERDVRVCNKRRTCFNLFGKSRVLIPATEDKSVGYGSFRKYGLSAVFINGDYGVFAVSAVVIRYGNLRNGYNAGVICFV